MLRGAVRWLGWLVLSSALAAPLPNGETPEYQVKAAFIYNFTKFVEWPAQRFSGPDAPIVIGVVGNDALAGEIERVVQNRRVNTRQLVVATFRTVAEARHVHVLFVAPESGWRSGPSGGPFPGVLTVEDGTRRPDDSSIIRFTTVDRKVRFEIDASSAEQAGLKISAQLLKLAAAVRRPVEHQP